MEEIFKGDSYKRLYIRRSSQREVAKKYEITDKSVAKNVKWHYPVGI